MNNLIDSTNKCTSIKIYTFTYSPLILRRLDLLQIILSETDVKRA